MASPWKRAFHTEVWLRRSQRTPLALGARLAGLWAGRGALPARPRWSLGRGSRPAARSRDAPLPTPQPAVGTPWPEDMLVGAGGCNPHPRQWRTVVCEAQPQWGKWEHMGIALGGNFFLLTHTKKIEIIASSSFPLLSWSLVSWRQSVNRTKVVRCSYGEGKEKIQAAAKSWKLNRSHSWRERSAVTVYRWPFPMRRLNKGVPVGKFQCLGTRLGVSQSTVNLELHGVFLCSCQCNWE